MPKWLKWVVAVALLPAAWGVSRALVRVIAAGAGADTFWVAFVAGAAIWLTVYLLLPSPTRTYVLGHELTHALWTLAMGGRVKGFKVGRDSGHVVVDRSNFLVVLAPYFFPVYAVLVVLIYGVGDFLWHWSRGIAWFHLVLGAAYGFHLTFTVDILQTRQTDIVSQGRLFSWVIIWLGNALVLLVGVAALTGGASVLTGLGWCLQEAGRAYAWLGRRF